MFTNYRPFLQMLSDERIGKIEKIVSDNLNDMIKAGLFLSTS